MFSIRCCLGLLAMLSLPALAGSGPVHGFIVQWRDTAPLAQRQALLATGDRSQPLQAGPMLGGQWQRLRSAQALNAAEAEARAAALRADPRVAAVLPDVREQRLDVLPSDTRYAQQWWLQSVTAGNTGAAGFSAAWVRSTGSPASGAGAVVAVLDSGITSHPELNPRVLPGRDFVSDAVYANDGDGRDDDAADPGDAISTSERTANPAAFGGCPEAALSSWHGTIIAGQLAAVSNNGDGVAAGNWFGRVLPVRVAGKCGAAVGDIVDGLRWAAGLAVDGVPLNPQPARVIVLSYGGVDACDLNSSNPSVAATARLYTDAIAEARQAGALVVVAAGNQRGSVGRPASCSGAFGVAALNREGYKASYSNFGAGVALATPGGDAPSGGTCDGQLADTGIVSTGNLGDGAPGNAGYVAASGTSFAAPAVAATATLMLALNPALTVAQLEAGLTLGARPHVLVPLLGNCAAGSNSGRCACTTATCGAGMLDAEQSLAYAAAPAVYVAPQRSGALLVDDRLRACAILMGKPPVDGGDPLPPPASVDAGSGGGAMSPGWLLALALALGLLRRRH